MMDQQHYTSHLTAWTNNIKLPISQAKPTTLYLNQQHYTSHLTDWINNIIFPISQAGSNNIILPISQV